MLIPQRLFGLIIALISAGGVYFTWSEATTKNEYYPKLAVFAPVGIVVGIFLAILPKYSGKPETTREIVVVTIVFVIGILLGIYNWYLVDPGFFGF